MKVVLCDCRIQQGDEEIPYVLGSGVVEVKNKFIGVAIVYKKVPNAVTVCYKYPI